MRRRRINEKSLYLFFICEKKIIYEKKNASRTNAAETFGGTNALYSI